MNKSSARRMIAKYKVFCQTFVQDFLIYPPWVWKSCTGKFTGQLASTRSYDTKAKRNGFQVDYINL